MSDATAEPEMLTFDRDNLPADFEVPGGAIWALFTQREPLKAIYVEGAFQVRLPLEHSLRDQLGVVSFPNGGWVAIDPNGDPFGIDPTEFSRIFEPTGGAGVTMKPTGAIFARLAEYVEKQGGSIGCGFANGEWSVSVVFGQEAEGSPMAGGAAHGLSTSLESALRQAAGECGLVTD